MHLLETDSSLSLQGLIVFSYGYVVSSAFSHNAFQRELKQLNIPKNSTLVYSKNNIMLIRLMNKK